MSVVEAKSITQSAAHFPPPPKPTAPSRRVALIGRRHGGDLGREVLQESGKNLPTAVVEGAAVHLEVAALAAHAAVLAEVALAALEELAARHLAHLAHARQKRCAHLRSLAGGEANEDGAVGGRCVLRQPHSAAVTTRAANDHPAESGERGSG